MKANACLQQVLTAIFGSSADHIVVFSARVITVLFRTLIGSRHIACSLLIHTQLQAITITSY